MVSYREISERPSVRPTLRGESKWYCRQCMSEWTGAVVGLVVA